MAQALECYSCRLCRRILFSEDDVEQHGVSGMAAGKVKYGASPCSSVFLAEVPAWLPPIEGRIECPKCGCRLGSLTWSGSPCSCGTWVTPAIQFHSSRIDRRITSAARVDADRKLNEAGRDAGAFTDGSAATVSPRGGGLDGVEQAGAGGEASPSEAAAQHAMLDPSAGDVGLVTLDGAAKGEKGDSEPTGDGATAGVSGGAAEGRVPGAEDREPEYLLRTALVLSPSDSIAAKFEEALRDGGLCEMAWPVNSTRELRKLLLERGYCPYALVVVAKACGENATHIAASHAAAANLPMVSERPSAVCDAVRSALAAMPPDRVKALAPMSFSVA